MRVLILSPHFPPSNAADMQRVRMVLPYLKEAGVDAEVLAVHQNQVACPQDPWLVDGLPKGVTIHRVHAVGLRWSKVPGLGTLSLRAMRALQNAGDQILAEKEFDLIYFSTTQFTTHLLGLHWKEKFQIPFLMDYQDPWVSDYYREHPEVTPPGGRFKYGLADWLNRRNEPKVIRECSGFTSVSPEYPKQLAKRYGGKPLPSIVLPFPGDTQDLDRVRDSGTTQSVFDPADGLQHWVYVGRGGEDMALAIRAFFHALRERGIPDQLRLHFIGTSYAAAGQGIKTIEPLAQEFGLDKIVQEHPDRIPYSETLRCLLDADGLVIPGSDDPAYTASKIYPYLLANKPMLAIFHEKSSVTSLMNSVGGGVIVPFSSEESFEEISTKIQRSAFTETNALKKIPLDSEAFRPYDARSQAQDLADFFNLCFTEKG